MRFWTSSETYKNIGHERTKLLSSVIEPKVNQLILTKNYGEGIILWTYIVISMTEEIYGSGFFKEIKKYNRIDKEIELRLRVDNKKLSQADESQALKLFCESILNSIDIARTELKIKNFDFRELKTDLNNLFKGQGWID